MKLNSIIIGFLSGVLCCFLILHGCEKPSGDLQINKDAEAKILELTNEAGRERITSSLLKKEISTYENDISDQKQNIVKLKRDNDKRRKTIDLLTLDSSIMLLSTNLSAEAGTSK